MISLRLKMMVLMFVATIVVWLLFMYISISYFEKREIAQYKYEVSNLTNAVIQLTKADLELSDYAAINRGISEFYTDSGVEFIAIYDAYSAPVAIQPETARIEINRLKIDQLKDGFTKYDGNKVYYISKGIQSSRFKNNLGRIYLGINIEPLFTTINKIRLYYILFGLVLLFLELLVVHVTSKNISRTIRGLVHSTKELIMGSSKDVCLKTNIIEIKELMDAYNTLAKDLRKYEKVLESKTRMAAIGETASQIAHDLRKPLTKMKSMLAILPDKQNDKLFLHEMSRDVELTIDRTNQMLSEILEFSNEPSSLEYKKHDPQTIVLSALNEVFSDKIDVDIEISYDFNHKDYLNVDANRIIRVLVNIISNAVESIVDRGNIWFKTVVNDNKMFLTVGNDGPLIPADIQKYIFDPFFTKNKSGGIGLGLAICQKIIELHGGSIHISSRINNGLNKTEFTLILPITKGNLDVKEKELIQHSNEFKLFQEENVFKKWRGNITNIDEYIELQKSRNRASYLLILDDEPLFRESVRSLLRSISKVNEYIKVVEASTAEEALKLFEEHRFDYVISDIDLGKGKMNGYDFAAHILDKYPNTYVLIHSNKRKEELDKGIREIKSDHFMGFLPKPMKQSELLQFLACKSFETIDDAKILKESKVIDEKLKKVLLVNDDETLLLSMRMMLKSACVQVIEAKNVSQALKLYAENKIDVILSDINLGKAEQTGYDFLKMVREKDASIPFYMMSGYEKSTEELKAIKLGATGYLQLPVDKEQLDQLICEK